MKNQIKLALLLLVMLWSNVNVYSQANTKYWDGGDFSTGTAWSDPTNWYPDGVPTANDHVIINPDRLGSFVQNFVIDVDIETSVKSLTIESQLSGSINTMPVKLSIFSNLTVLENINISANSLVEVLNSQVVLNIGGDWVNKGLFLHGNGTVNFNQPNARKLKANEVFESYTQPPTDPYTASVGMHDEHANAFFNLIFSAGTTTLDAYLRVENNLSIQNQNTRLNASNANFNIELWGNWQNEGTYDATLGKVIFASNLPQNIGKGFRTAATATATVANGAVTNINLVNAGTKYAQAPMVVIEGGEGYGATATATIDANGSVNSIQITSAGAGFTSVPTVRFTPVAKENFYNVDVYKPFHHVSLLARTEVQGTLDFRYGKIISASQTECILGYNGNIISASASAGNGYVDGPLGRIFISSAVTTQEYILGKGTEYAGSVQLSLGLSIPPFTSPTKVLFVIERFNSLPADGRIVPQAANVNHLLNVHYKVQHKPYPLINSGYTVAYPIPGDIVNFSNARIGLPLNLNVESFTKEGNKVNLATLPIADLENFRVLVDPGDDTPDFYGNPRTGHDTERPYHTPGAEWLNLGGINNVNASIGASTVLNATTTFKQLGTGTFALAIRHNTLGVKQDQTITFNALSIKKYGDAGFDLNATASSGLAVSYTSSNPSVATVSGNKVTIVGVGTTNITASQGGNNNYNTATPVVRALVVEKADQSISFAALASKRYKDADFDLTATASSGLPVTYVSSNPAVATVSGNTVTIVGVGYTQITASQAGNANYNVANAFTQTLVVNKTLQTISFAALPDKDINDPDFQLNATASSGLAVTYVSSNPTVATVSGNTVSIVGIGTTCILASQPGNDLYEAAPQVLHHFDVTGAVVQKEQAISFAALADKKVNDAGFDLAATASSGLPVSYISTNPAVATVSGNTVTIVSAGTTTIVASQAGGATYKAAADVKQTLIVGKLPQTISFAALPFKTLDSKSFKLGATTSSGLAVTYASTNTAVATVSGNTVTIVGAGTTQIVASQAGNATYKAAVDVLQELNVYHIPKSPVNLQRTNAPNDHTKAVLAWEDKSDNELGFFIKRSVDNKGTNFEIVAWVEAGVNTYTDEFDSKGKEVYYVVTAYNKAGESAPSNRATITVISQVNNGSAEEIIRPYPNPMINSFGVEVEHLATDQTVTVYLTRPQGDVVKLLGTWSVEELAQQQFDISGVPSGTYLLQIVQGNNTFTKRLVKL